LAENPLPLEPLTARNQEHFHIAVRLLVEGEIRYPPRKIGAATPLRNLIIHTHDQSGVIHIHRPENQRLVSFKDLMNVWGKQYSPTNFADLAIDNNRGTTWQAQIRVNNKPVAYGKDFLLSNRQDIVIILTTPSSRNNILPVEPFDWTNAPLRENQ
jgi:hypothetical protein